MVKRIIIITWYIILILSSGNVAYSQVIADFIADDTIGCNPLTVKFTNTGSTGSDIIYQWTFGSIGTSDVENPTFTFANPNDIQEIFPVTLVVTDTGTLENDILVKYITVIRTPSAELIIDSANACVNGDVIFHTGYDSKDSVIWNYGDGNVGRESISQDVYHAYASNGTYELQFITFSKNCSDTSNYSINVKGPVAGFAMSQKEACINSPILYTIIDTSGVSSFSWDFGNGEVFNQDSVYYSYDMADVYITQLLVSGPAGNCMIDDTAKVLSIAAGFTYADNRFCDQQYINFQDTSTGADFRFWDFGNGNTGTGSNSAQLYSPGNYIVKLIVSNELGCVDSTQDDINVNELPSLQLSGDSTICIGRSIMLNAISNAQKILWTPGASLNNPSIFNPVATPDSTTKYYITVTDTLTRCRQFGQLTLFIQDENEPHDLPFLKLSNDTGICTGMSIIIRAISDAQKIIWDPATGLNNAEIFEPLASPESTITYNVTVTDTVTKCRQSDQLTIAVQNSDSLNNISVLPGDTSIVVGEYVSINVYDSLERELNYIWTPDDGHISCINCPNPIVQPLESKTYLLEVSDPYYCYLTNFYNVVINVKDEYIIGVPDAFTPNGDGVNDEIKVDGWGIKKLIEFRIFNRWGTEVFFTDAKEQGWDGYFKNKLQNMDSYTYFIKAELWNDQITEKKGSFSLIR